jgi:hypothetical protein
MRSAARARDSRDFTVPASNVEGASDLSVVKTVQLVEYERGAIRWCQISESAVDRSSQAAMLQPGIRAIGRDRRQRHVLRRIGNNETGSRRRNPVGVKSPRC